MSQWTITRGLGGSWKMYAVDSNGDPVAYIGTETLAGNVWPGGSRASLITLAPTWVDPTAGVSRVAISGDDSAALEAAGIYDVLCTVDDGFSGPLPHYRGTLQVLSSPGTGVDLPSYCSYADLLNCISWLDTLDTSTSTTGFNSQRAAARRWTDNLIQRHYRGGGGLSRDNYFLPWPQYVPGNSSRLSSVYRSGANSPTLQGWLDAGGLKLSQPIIDANVYYAIAKVLDQQIARGGENQYKTLAREFLGRAEDLIVQADAEIDSSGSAYATTTQTVKLGSVDTLEG